MVAPLVLLGGLALTPQVADPCAPTTTTTVAVTTTVPATTTVPPVVYSVGDVGPGGGIVFYDAGSIQSWGRYLEVACVGWSDGTCGGNDSTDLTAVWGCYGTLITGADGRAIGTGKQNTTDITAPVGGCSTAGIAARLANDLTLGGQNDWFLPSKDELNALCKWAYGDTVNAICNDGGFGGLFLTYGGFSADGYWSSSEFGDSSAWSQGFHYGGQFSATKGTNSVRPVRAF